MNKLATVFMATTAVLAGVCVWLAYEVGVARDAADAALARQRLQPVPAPGPAQSAATWARLGREVGREESPDSGPESPADEFLGADNSDPWVVALTSPAAKRVAAAEIRARIKELNADFLAMQQLDRADSEAFLSLVQEHEIAGANAPYTNEDDSRELHEAREREFRAKLRELIGEQRAEEFDAYQRTLIPRAEIDQFAAQLDALGVPLTADQRLRLMRGVVHDRLQFTLPDPGDNPGEEYFAALAELEESRSDRLATFIRTVLTGAQLRHFEDVLERERERELAEAHASR